jgi:hypothetical protein
MSSTSFSLEKAVHHEGHEETRRKSICRKACRGHQVHPEGDCPIIDSALNNFVFFVPFVVQLPNFGS